MAFFGLAVLVLALFPRTAAAQNLVTNGTFDTNIAGWSGPAAPYPQWSAEDAAGSPSSGSIDVPAQGRAYSSSFATVAGQSYQLSASLKDRSTGDTTINQIRLVFSNGGFTATGCQINLSHSSGWIQVSSQPCVAPTNTVQAQVQLILGSSTSGDALFDNVSVTVASPAPTASFSASPTSIQAGQSATLTWSTANATSVTIDNGVGSEPASGSVSVSPSVTTTYTLTATGAGGTVMKQATVTVTAPAPTATFSASPTTIISGQASTLSWTTTNATSVTIDNGLGSEPLNGSVSVNPTATRTYTLTATGAGGTVTKQVTITVSTPPAATFTANPTTITAGQSSTLTWTTSGAATVTIDGQGQVLNGSINVTPTQTTTYTLVATSSGGASTTKQATVTVTAPAPTATFSASPTTIISGQASTLSWTTTNATSVTIDNGLGSQPVSGSVPVMPGTTTTYRLTAAGAGGTVTKQVTVTVNDPPAITFAASPTSITTGQSSTLTWTTSNATTVSIDNGFGAQPLAGSFIVSPATTTTYTLTANGAGGTRTATATVSVGAPGSPQVTFSASPGTIAAGGSATLTWTTTNATSVSIDHGIGARPLAGSFVVSPTQTTTYTLAATGSGGTRTATASVTIAPAPTIVFTATPPAVLPGGSVKLEWQVFDATFVVIDPDLGAQPFSGAATITPKATTVYTLMATGIGGVRSMTVTVAVGGKRRAAKH